MDHFIAASDYHGSHRDAAAESAFFSAVSVIDPRNKHKRLMLGDLFNLAALRKGADEDDRRNALCEDIGLGLAFLEKFKPTVLLLGNHDQRLYDAVSSQGMGKSGPMSELCASYVEDLKRVCKALKCVILPYDKRKGVYKIGSLSFAHGFGHGSKLCENMASAYGDCVFGHGHKIVRNTVMRGRPVTGYQIGTLAQKDMHYVRSDLSALRQQHGFAYGVVDGRRHTVLTPEIVDGKVCFATVFWHK